MSQRLEELVWLFTKTIVKSTTYVFSDKILECQENNSYDEISRNKDLSLEMEKMYGTQFGYEHVRILFKHGKLITSFILFSFNIPMRHNIFNREYWLQAKCNMHTQIVCLHINNCKQHVMIPRTLKYKENDIEPLLVYLSFSLKED